MDAKDVLDNRVRFIVLGIPAPQGSKKHVGRGIMVESSKLVKPWRQAVEQAVMIAAPFGSRSDPILFRGPVAVDVAFFLSRPKSAKKGARPSARPDIDKLMRSTFDAMTTAGVYEDDGRIVSVIAEKWYVGDERYADALPVSGAIISVECV